MIKLKKCLFTPQEFGALADGAALATDAVQAAVDAAHEAGGGTVFFAPGKYVIGSVYLRSFVTLELSNGAQILGSTAKEHYRKLEETSPEITDRKTHGWQNLHEYAYFGMFLADSAENVVIRGEGTIDGQGNVFVPKYDSVYPAVTGALHTRHRPVIFHFYRCRNVTISGITLKNPAGWLQCHLLGDGLSIEGVKIHSLSAWNNDGIDLVDTRNVVIRGCRINCADDAICMKSTSRVVENVVVSDCIIRSSASAVKCGTGSAQGFRNITVTNLVIYDTARSGIALQAVDGGTIEFVNISNITMRNVGNAIFMRIGDRARIHHAHKNVGAIRDVSISNVLAEISGFDADAGYDFRAPRHDPLPNPLPSVMAGLKQAPICGVRFSHVQLIYTGQLLDPSRVVTSEKCTSVPEAESAYPEYDQFGDLPAWGFYIRHARDIAFDDVRLVLRGDDVRPAILADDLSDSRFAMVDIAAQTDGIVFNKSTRLFLSNNTLNGKKMRKKDGITHLE